MEFLSVCHSDKEFQCSHNIQKNGYKNLLTENLARIEA